MSKFKKFQKLFRLHEAWVEIVSKLSLILENQETIMVDITALKAVAAKLQASDTKEIALLQSLKDQNTALAAQLAAIKPEDPAIQAEIDAVVQQLTASADAVDSAVAANSSVPDLGDSPVPTPQPDA